MPTNINDDKHNEELLDGFRYLCIFEAAGIR